METIRLIPVGKSHFAVVDADLYDWLNQWNWSRHSGGYAFRLQYGYGNGKPKASFMHALIMGDTGAKEIDHINGCGLDNRRQNLRLATHLQNSHNSRKHQRGKITSSHKGVWKTKKGKWVSQIGVDGKRIHVGTFDSEKQAAAAFNEAAKKHHGEFARLNVLN